MLEQGQESGLTDGELCNAVNESEPEIAPSRVKGRVKNLGAGGAWREVAALLAAAFDGWQTNPDAATLRAQLVDALDALKPAQVRAR